MKCGKVVVILCLILEVSNKGFCDSISNVNHDQSNIQSQFSSHMSQQCAAYFNNDDESLNLKMNAFINARYELSLVDKTIRWRNVYSKKLKSTIDRFFKINQSSCLYKINDTIVWYISIFKAGNNNIRGNLQVQYILACYICNSSLAHLSFCSYFQEFQRVR